jgi:uncharacterized protein (DUF2252 family)
MSASALFASLAVLSALAPTTASPSVNPRPANFNAATFLDAQNGDLTRELRDRKFIAMEASAFVFFRGANAIYWRDMCTICCRCFCFCCPTVFLPNFSPLPCSQQPGSAQVEFAHNDNIPHGRFAHRELWSV